MSTNELDKARAERDVALAQMARTRAIIERKTIRAPFRARIGISDVHPGQYLNEGTELTSLQGVDDAAYVDFTVAQQVAAALERAARVDILAPAASRADRAARRRDRRARRPGDPERRRACARRCGERVQRPAPSVRVRVPVGPPRLAVAVPVNALRKGPARRPRFRDRATTSRARPAPTCVRSRAGALLGDEVLIESGLAPGERVAASGSFKLRDAVLVAIARRPAPDAPKVAAR